MLEFLLFCPEDNFEGCAKFYKFVEWDHKPSAMRRPKTRKAFAKLINVKQSTLARWKKRINEVREENNQNKNKNKIV